MALPLPGDAVLAGAKLAVTPFGIPLTVNPTAAANPFAAAVVTVIGINPPRATTAFVPPSASVKLGPMTVRLSVCVLLIPPPEPDTVSV